MNITYTIARYEQISSDTFLVAFNIKSDSGDSVYIESPIPLSETSGKLTTEICQLAYNKIKDKIELIKQKMQSQKFDKIGYQFIPE